MKKSTKIITACLVALAFAVVLTVYFAAMLYRLSFPYSDSVLASVQRGEAVTMSEVTERLGHPVRSEATRWDLMYTDETGIPFQRQYLYVKKSPDGLRIIDAKVVLER